MFATKTELTIDTPTNVIENNKYFEISGTWNDARGVIPETSVRKNVSASKTSMVSNNIWVIIVGDDRGCW